MKTLMRDKICTGEGCTKAAVTMDVCMAHYMRARRARAARSSTVDAEKQIRMCSVTTCDSAAAAKGMCRRHYKIAWRYSLTPGEVDDFESATECGLCQRVRTEDRGLVVDHDHSCCPGNKSCGKCVRGYICTGCNQALGKLDVPGAWERFAEYLGKPLTLQC